MGVAVGGTAVAAGGTGAAVGVAWAQPHKRQMAVIGNMLLRKETADGMALPPANCHRRGKSSRQDNGQVESWRLVLEEKPCFQLTTLMLRPCVRRVSDLKHAVIRGNGLAYAVP